MSSWEDELIASLKARQAATDEAGTASADKLHADFSALVETFETSIRRITEALGVEVPAKGGVDEARVRWIHGTHKLAIRLDASAEKIFVTADVGSTLDIDELVLDGEQLVDQRGRPTDNSELAERFVSLLFRSA